MEHQQIVSEIIPAKPKPDLFPMLMNSCPEKSMVPGVNDLLRATMNTPEIEQAIQGLCDEDCVIWDTLNQLFFGTIGFHQ